MVENTVLKTAYKKGINCKKNGYSYSKKTVIPTMENMWLKNCLKVVIKLYKNGYLNG